MGFHGPRGMPQGVARMKKHVMSALAVPLAFAIGACADSPVAPKPLVARDAGAGVASAKGSGLVLNSLTNVTLPLIGSLGDVTVDQAVLTNFALVENTVGAIVGVEVDGVLQLTGGVLGTDVITQNFNTTASVTSSGPGQCSLVSIDLGPIGIDALGLAKVDVPAANVTGKGSGAVG